MTDERLIYLPLGGAGEIGMNCYVYGYGLPGRERLIVVDLGVTFPDMDTTPGIDLIMPDVSWLEKRADQIEAIFITHAHEDHIGALAHMWPKLKAPVYARRFTAAIGRYKLEDQGLPKDTITTVEARPDVVEAGPFSVQFVPISHSVPESSALVIDSPAGRVLHTGDFKLDPAPVVGEPWDPATYAAIAEERPVKALMCDSTNIFTQHPGRSESTLTGPLRELIGGARGMVVATTFASNVARLKTLAEAARASGRSVCLLGRAMRRMVATATETGILQDFPPTISPEQVLEMPRDNVLLIVTGSQGERRAASAQLARGKYLGIELKEGDLFLFSSRTIPGNEREVGRIMNALSEKGVDLQDDAGGLYHVSGHANRPDLVTVHSVVKPELLIPMHGEHRHLREHARVGAEGGTRSLLVTNGAMIDLTGDAPKIVERVETRRSYLDGSILIGAFDGVVRDRIRLALNGHVMINVILDESDDLLGDVWVEVMGLPERGQSGGILSETLERELTEYLEGAGAKLLNNDDRLEEALRRMVRQIGVVEIGKKPETTVTISRLQDE
ncbi:ribonuclease J [Falsirhodobacter algicola]|uniref:MBL fold metallo-hydrolase n=1 Tax=Falsirhodobacter algicola TaxID=2692330 RepID=A0A8J8MRQ1_9RHOB|nr:ribonuclease J [Falsirhodobacter algicola]QUS35505.1 MBL fold metallo-hydrolase [Falsirhodobacter algicola]